MTNVCLSYLSPHSPFTALISPAMAFPKRRGTWNIMFTSSYQPGRKTGVSHGVGFFLFVKICHGCVCVKGGGGGGGAGIHYQVTLSCFNCIDCAAYWFVSSQPAFFIKGRPFTFIEQCSCSKDYNISTPPSLTVSSAGSSVVGMCSSTISKQSY